MVQISSRIDKNRVRAGAGVLLLHLLVGYAFLTGLASKIGTSVADELKVFDVPEPIPPPPEPEIEPAKERRPNEEGAAAPPNLKSKPTPVVAPPPKVKLEVPPPVVTAPEPSPVTGNDPSAGAAEVPGPGTGSGGIGNGTGSGGSGTGPGGGGGGRAAARVRGGFTSRDYSRIAADLLLEGTVHVRYTIRPDGYVTNCSVTKSSGHFRLDRATCEIIEDRFRYRPALDAHGRPVPSTKNTSFSWSPDQR